VPIFSPGPRRRWCWATTSSTASKAASDHLVNAWHHTYGPWKFPEKLIPVVILKPAAGEPIPLYGDGQNVRDCLYVDALVLAATQGTPARAYCGGGHGERTNKQVVEAISSALLDALLPAGAPHDRRGSHTTALTRDWRPRCAGRRLCETLYRFLRHDENRPDHRHHGPRRFVSG
jgi:nucleoside-diphosphate-sugar epimerase